MNSGYGRPLSPPRNRYHPPGGPRVSAGSFFSTSAYDPYAASTRTSRDYVPGPRISDERVGASRLVPIRQRSPPRRAAVDDYVVAARPRRATLEPEAQRIRRPVSMIVPSDPARSSRPIVTSAVDRPPSPVTNVRRERRDEDYQVLPASSSSRRHHQRHSSLTAAESNRLMPLERDTNQPVYRPSNTNRPPLRERRDENDKDFGFEYTDSRDTKLQDPVYRERSRRDSYNSARPKSMIMPEGYIPRSNRDPGPPVSSRGFENIGRSQSQRRGYTAREDERLPRDYGRDEREPLSRKPARSEIALHQPAHDGIIEEESRKIRSRKPDDERLEPHIRSRKPGDGDEVRMEPRGRDSQDGQVDRRDEDLPRRHRHKHSHRDPDRTRDDNRVERGGRDDRDRRSREERREERPDRRDKLDDETHSTGILAGAGAAAAATGLAAEGVRRHRRKEYREDDEMQTTRRTRDQAEVPGRDIPDLDRRPRAYSNEPRREDLDIVKRPRDHLEEPHRDDIDTSSVSTGPSTAEDREYQEARELSHQAKKEAEHFIGPVEPELRQQKSYERRPEPDYTRHHRSYRPRRHHPATRDEESYSSSSSSSSSDSEDDKGRRQVRVVTPSNEDKPPPIIPKSILRKPREKFPEHPTTVREGVAPHKDQKKKDVPPNARWTKIDRRFVNPEALEADGIRFNEFVDHVIVLKVMDIEEIEKYTQKTAEIRAKRRMLMGPEESQGPLPAPALQAEGSL